MGARIEEGLFDAESGAQTVHGYAAVGFEELSIGFYAHLANVVASVNGEEAVGDEMMLLDVGCYACQHAKMKKL